MYPKDFLYKLDKQHNKIIYARVISLDKDERPLESIEGRITAGSVNIDGASAVRRSCQLSLVAENVNISDYAWSLNTKFKLYTGVLNTIDNRYPEIIWFKQGTYVITSFNQSYSASSYTISINGKDKMCLLNGEVAGKINSSVDFGTIEQEVAPNVWKKIKQPVKDIIREAVHTYAGEPFHNIIINDLDQVGLTLQEYRYDAPMYLLRQEDNYTQAFINGKTIVELDGKMIALENLINEPNFNFDNLQEDFATASPSTEVKWGNNIYTVAKIDYGETAGYTETDLVYPSDLISSIGESITSIFDKIKKFLGEFEYFYNLDGQFIFQKKPTYMQTSWSPVKQDGMGSSYIEPLMLSDSFVYEFTDSEFFTAFNDTPDINNVRNDFTVWGNKKGVSNNELAIHMRFAIDNKPIQYRTIKVSDEDLVEYNKKNGLSVKGQVSTAYISSEDPYKVEYVEKEEEKEPEIAVFNLRFMARSPIGDIYYDPNTQMLTLKVSGSLQDDYLKLNTVGTYDSDNQVLNLQMKEGEYAHFCDWREIIYRMALDYSKYSHLDDFQNRVAEANPELYSTGRTGYEQYYIDLQGFWRDLYNPFEDVDELNKEYNRLIQSSDSESKQRLNEIEAKNKKYYYWNLELGTVEKTEELMAEHSETIESNSGESIELGTIFVPIEDRLFGWARDIYEEPQLLNFWFDFLDTDGELKHFSVPNLGARAKVEKDDQVKAIYYKEVPNIIFQASSKSAGKTGYRYFNAPNVLSMFNKSTQGKSAKEAIDDMLYNYTYCNESISITSVPIYHLDANTRIHIKDEKAGIDGDYIISKITIPLTYNSTMTIAATKAVQRLL